MRAWLPCELLGVHRQGGKSRLGGLLQLFFTSPLTLKLARDDWQRKHSALHLVDDGLLVWIDGCVMNSFRSSPLISSTLPCHVLGRRSSEGLTRHPTVIVIVNQCSTSATAPIPLDIVRLALLSETFVFKGVCCADAR